MQFDQDTIKDIAVHCVQRFVSDKTPLDVSIAEKAKSFQLNEEQVRRVVEATNTIAFLKLRDGASDKTFEFQVASFQGVMNALVGAPSTHGYVLMDSDEEPSLSKQASESEYSVDLSDDQKHLLLGKHLHHVRGEMEKVALDYFGVTADLEKYVFALTKQANWQERLEKAANKDFDKIMSVFGNNGFEKKASLEDIIFVGKELEVANSVVSLIKQASELSVRKSELETMEKRAWAALASLVGKGLRGIRGTPKVKGVMSGSGGVVSGANGVGGKPGLGESIYQSSTKTAKAASGIGKDPLKATAHTASALAGGMATAATAPIGAAIGAGIRGGAYAVKRVRKTALGTAGVAGMALSAATYQPKINERTGRPNDVWANIYD